MIRMHSTTSNGIITSQVISKLDQEIKQQAIQKLSEYITQGICASSFSDPKWLLTNKRDRYYFSFNFSEDQLKRVCFTAGTDYSTFIENLKIFVILLIGRCSLEFLREFISFTIKETINSDYYSAKRINHSEYNASQIRYYYEFVSLIYPLGTAYLNYIKDIMIRIERQSIESKSAKRQPCTLAEFQTYFIFDELINDWWLKAEQSLQYYFYPLYLFWRLTTILPLRVMEFCLTPLDCISKSNGNYYITIRRTVLKGNNGAKKIVKHHYNLEDDYQLCKYQVTEEIFRLFDEYTFLSSGFHRNDNLLFSLVFMQKYNPSPHKKGYDKSSVFNVEALNKLLSDFYDQIIVGQYNYSIVSDQDLRERYTGMEENSYGIQIGEMMKIKCKHTRHLSMINLVYCGCNPMIIKDFAGHADEGISANYYGNTTKTAKCITKILYDKYKSKNLKENVLAFYNRAPLSFFIDESSEYIELDEGKCFSGKFIANSDEDCKQCGFNCRSCNYYIPHNKDSIRVDEDEINEEMELISSILKRDDINQRIEEYQKRYLQFQHKLGNYIIKTWENQNGENI